MPVLQIVSRLEEKWSAVKVPLNVPSFEDVVSYHLNPNGSPLQSRQPLRLLDMLYFFLSDFVDISSIYIAEPVTINKARRSRLYLSILAGWVA